MRSGKGGWAGAGCVGGGDRASGPSGGGRGDGEWEHAPRGEEAELEGRAWGQEP